MRRWAITSALALIAIFAVGDFAVQPLRLLWVGVIALGGGLITLAFCRLPPPLQRRVKLFAIGLAASFLTVFAGYLLYQIAGLSSQLGVLPGPALIKGIAWSFAAAALLWFEFYVASRCNCFDAWLLLDFKPCHYLTNPRLDPN
jgi:hypothetical protein